MFTRVVEHQPVSRSDAGQSTRTIVAWMALAAVGLAGGCTSIQQWHRNGFKVGPNYRQPSAPVAEKWIDAADERVKADGAADDWWTRLNDPTLDGLVQTAYLQNLDLQTAGTRILDARAQRNIASGNLFPQSQSAIAAYVRGQVGKNFVLPVPSELNLFATGFNASWEADFWGRYRRTIAASQATLDASVDGYRDALVMLLADVATNYVQYRTYQQRLEYARRNVDIQTSTLDLAQTRFDVGTTTELDVQQAKSNLAQTRSTIPPLEIGLRQAGNSLCILLGIPASDLSAMLEVKPIPTAPVELAIGIPADLLRRRPDVRRAERDVAAQSEQIGIATADFYPRLSINGVIGYTGNNLKDLFSSKGFTGVVFPTFQWNILNYGRILNNVRAQDANFRGKVLTYQQTVLRAGREVENGLVAFLQTQVQARRLEESAAAAQRSVELVTDQYQGGVTDFNRVYNTQATLVNAQDQLAVARGNIALNLIAVYKALGGGWQSFGPPAGVADGRGQHGHRREGH
ncbi:MAG TPA: efflux transporter outer membrane subunit [Pirellulales bacterium]|nr:efflux transporter outer membrane subunit [Pirellulales bacterium]